MLAGTLREFRTSLKTRRRSRDGKVYDGQGHWLESGRRADIVSSLGIYEIWFSRWEDNCEEEHLCTLVQNSGLDWSEGHGRLNVWASILVPSTCWEDFPFSITRPAKHMPGLYTSLRCSMLAPCVKLWYVSFRWYTTDTELRNPSRKENYLQMS
jgi:hypothetical protein